MLGLNLCLVTSASARASEAAKGCREAFADHVNTIRACNVVISSPSLLIPALIRALEIRAQAYLATGQAEPALADYTRAIENLPKGQLQGYILYLRGKTRLTYFANSRDQRGLGLNDLEQANAQAPANTRILEALADTYIKQGRPAEAIHTATEALSRDARSVLARKIRARAHERTGRARLALADLDILLSRTPHDHALLVWRGRIHQKRNNVHAALADFRKAARILSTDEILARIDQLERILR